MAFGVSTVIVFAVLLSGAAMYGCPKYNVYSSEMAGKAELAQAEYNRQVKTLEAVQAQESSKHLAQAEIERAKGVAEANRIIGDSLKGNEDYLRYLWIHNLSEAEKNGAQVIYVPTEANLPILEASRQPVKKVEK
jgi:regulator of protease activity HflC (stomatin/prohibitin superfamily)